MTPAMTPAPLTSAVAAAPTRHRDLRPQTPLWRVTGLYTLKTPLHIGTGRDEPITAEVRDAAGQLTRATRHVATVVRDHRGHPCVPASSFKGALNELARRTGMAAPLRERLFGSDVPGRTAGEPSTRAGAVEFTWLYAVSSKLPTQSELPDFPADGHPYEGHPSHVAHLPHVARNRHTGAAQDQLLYLQQVLPPDAQFRFECTARGLAQTDIEALLGLLALAGAPHSPFRLGAGQAADQGRVEWSDGDVRQLTSVSELWRALLATEPGARPIVGARAADNTPLRQPQDLWSPLRTLAKRPAQSQPAVYTVPDGDGLSLTALQLKFHSPFIVYQARNKQPGSGDPDGGPRTNHSGCPVLPAHSLHGALRAQAERILRTVGRDTPAGYEVPGVQGLQPLANRLRSDQLDLASLLFGAPGWRSLLRCSDFTAPKDSPRLTHHMLAIDRITGGGKDSAKFAVEVLDCPTLTGHLHLDLRRLRTVDALCPGTTARALGLLAHVLRDLDQGDLALGYGAAKGYGQLTSSTAQKLRTALQSPAAPLTLEAALTAFAATLPAADVGGPPAADAAAQPSATPLPLQAPPPPADASSDSSRFHNPYVFIPFGQARPDDPDLPWADTQALRNGNAAHHSHARYAANVHHGVLTCRLTTTTPVFVGAGDAPDTKANPRLPKLKQHYTLDGAPALPATSLRGMLASLHEAISASRVRAATNRQDSVRWVNAMQKDDPAPSAIGRLMSLDNRPGLWLQMLALPVLDMPLDDARQREWRIRIPKAYKPLIQPGQPAPLKSLFGDKSTDFSNYVPSGEPRLTPEAWYIENRLGKKVSIESGSNGFELVIDRDAEPQLHLKVDQNSRRPGLLLGVRRRPNEKLVRIEKDKPLRPSDLPPNPQRGFVRVMSAPGRDLPTGTRSHEVFVPFNKDQEGVRQAVHQFMADEAAQGRSVTDQQLIERFHILPIPDDVITQFCRLADAMTATQDNDPDLVEAAWRPYHPIGSHRNHGEPSVVYSGLSLKNAKRALRPKHNDLVYFRPEDNGASIAEISYSSLWRREISLTTADFLQKDHLASANQGLLCRDHQPQKLLSPSELLFGSVELRGGPNPCAENATGASQPPILAWAGKVWFSAAKPVQPVQHEREVVTLKILSSPKPPSPAMYFQPVVASRGIPTKADLWKQPDQYRLRGRKTYLHALRDAQGRVRPLGTKGLPDANGCAPWASANPTDPQTVQQKVRVQPLSAGNVFKFSVRFANLSRAELESLCAALRPDAGFEHKIGMGKPIGLGSVAIEFDQLQLSNRALRYRQTSFESAVETTQAATYTLEPDELARQHLHRLQRQNPAVLRALQLVGNPAHVRYPVHYPQNEGLEIEKESYQWFVDNDKTGRDLDKVPRQALETITATSTTLRGLSRKPRQR